MYYTCLHVTCHPDFTEILMAEIAEAGFDTFMETDHGFEAYAEDSGFQAETTERILSEYRERAYITYYFTAIEKKNWNEEWERNYTPVIVDDTCLIRAEFHKPERAYPIEIIVTPRMSFGTGHHPTTYLMVQSQLQISHEGKRVMDAGCGTAILSILASKLGAKEVEAFDIDEWSVSNGNENIQINGCHNIHLRQGKISELTFTSGFDLILANINKNILLEEMPLYVHHLVYGGKLLLSGFYEQDIPELLEKAAELAFKEDGRNVRDSWASLLLTRP